jgi:predicted DNA-binding protein with PD1-like motif
VRFRSVEGGWALVLERGDDLHASLQRLAREAGIASGFFAGLGAVDAVQLAYWDLERKEYARRDFSGDHEIGALVGNLTRLDGEPFVHAHAVVGGPDFVAYTGHLMRARCAATVEIFVHAVATPIVRGPAPEIGLNLCRL